MDYKHYKPIPLKEVVMDNQESNHGSNHGSHKPPSCSRCGSRLFLESEYRGWRLRYFWEYSLGCSREFNLDGSLIAYPAGARRVRVVKNSGVPVLVR